MNLCNAKVLTNIKLSSTYYSKEDNQRLLFFAIRSAVYMNCSITYKAKESTLYLYTVSSTKRQDFKTINFSEMARTICLSALTLGQEAWIYPIYKELSTTIFHLLLLIICKGQAALAELYNFDYLGSVGTSSDALP